MPQQVTCSECESVLYKGDELKSPEEILQMCKGICQKCGRKLSLDPKRIEIEADSNRSIGKFLSS